VLPQAKHGFGYPLGDAQQSNCVSPILFVRFFRSSAGKEAHEKGFLGPATPAGE
jgi:hypothetical protein